MKDVQAPTCPLVARHAALLAEQERLQESLREIQSDLAELEDVMQRANALLPRQHQFEITQSADGQRCDPSSLSDGAPVGGGGPAVEAPPGDRGDGGSRQAIAPIEPAAALPPKPAPKRRTWTDADCAKMQELVLEGHDWLEVARRMGRSDWACRAKAGKIDGFIRPNEVKARAAQQLAEAEQAQQQQLAAELQTMQTPAVSHATPWSDDEDLALMSGREAGRPWQAIADELGRSVKACTVRYARLRVPSGGNL